MRTILASFGLAVLLSVPPPVHADSPSDSIAPGSQLGFLLLRDLAGEGAPQVLVSPLGITSALSLALAGARGRTGDEIAEVTGLVVPAAESGRTPPFADVLSRLSGQGDALRFANASSVWARRGLGLHRQFLDDMRQRHVAVESVDFGRADVTRKINRWGRKATRGGIREVVSSPPPDDTQLYLLNAIYFKDLWSDPFEPAETAPRPFASAEGAVRDVPMMSRSAKWSYAEADGLQIVRLPYKTPDLAMYVLLPPSNGLLPWLASADAVAWESLLVKMADREGRVSLPRFQTTYSTTLKRSLLSAGIRSAFGDSADFSGISDAKFGVTDVIHKTRIEVTEGGTEASAVTSVLMGTTSVSMEPPFEFRADRPFFYAIRDDRSGVLLFAGLVLSP